MKKVSRRGTRTTLERAIDERTAMSMVGAVNHAVDTIVDEIAYDVLSNPEFRRLLQELVSRRFARCSPAARGRDERSTIAMTVRRAACGSIVT